MLLFFVFRLLYFNNNDDELIYLACFLSLSLCADEMFFTGVFICVTVIICRIRDFQCVLMVLNQECILVLLLFLLNCGFLNLCCRCGLSENRLKDETITQPHIPWYWCAHRKFLFRALCCGFTSKIDTHYPFHCVCSFNNNIMSNYTLLRHVNCGIIQSVLGLSITIWLQIVW